MTSLAAPASRNAACPCGSGKRFKDCHGALRPSAMQWVQRALREMQERRFVAAEASFREAVKLEPDDGRIHADIATLCILQNRHDDAEGPLARALELEPDHPYALCVYTHIRQRHCAWQGLADLHRRVGEVLDRGIDARYQFSVFPILSMPTTPAQQRIAAEWTASMFAPPTPLPRPKLQLHAGHRLRIGFVTSDFRPHPRVSLMMELWERIDRGCFEMFAYGLSPRDAGPVGQRVERAFEHFVDVAAEPDERIAQRIRDDRIAVVFDLNGYTTHAREKVFALRPAPLQVNAIGFQCTLGTTWHDYILCDRFCIPEPLQRYYSERPLYMPHMLYPSDTTRLPQGSTPSRTSCGLPEHGFVFCCFNNAYKILPETFAAWMRLLACVPSSVLWLLEAGTEAKRNLRGEAVAAGIDPQRLIFAPRVSVAEHVARHAAADLFLDTFPYGAHTTANDALLAGLPLVTRVGETLVSRIAGSQLSAIGLAELIAGNLADYEGLALAMATDPARLARCRDRLALHRRTAPLFDMARYARDFESAVLRIWDEHASAQ
jgi:predicted O-linked N-acetylglucosamine transferase (SPINDLY family)